MNQNNEIESLTVPAGKRTYFIDVKKTREGAKYLKISESKRLENGEYERHQVLIFEEDINNIAEAVKQLLVLFPTYKKSETKSSMEKSKEQFENAYKPWTETDDLKLTQLFCEGNKPKELSVIFKRNVGAINSRIEKLELKAK